MKFGDYLWNLLSRPFKAKENETRKYVDVIGSSLDEGKTAILSIRRNWYLRTAPVEALPLMGEGLKLPQKPGETNEAYRERLIAAYDWYLWGGTRHGVLRAIASVINVPCWIREFYENAWQLGKSRLNKETRLYDADYAFIFSVIFERQLTTDEEQLVRKMVDLTKPAHTTYFFVYPNGLIQSYWNVGKSRLGVDTILK